MYFFLFPLRSQGIEVGPNLGLFKSSSLESLHNVMQHAIKRDIVDDGSDLRNRSTRNSFRRAVDRTVDGQHASQEGTGEQRGVDGEILTEILVWGPLIGGRGGIGGGNEGKSEI